MATLREKVEAVRDAGVSRRYMELLLLQPTMTPDDRDYVEKVYKILAGDRHERRGRSDGNGGHAGDHGRRNSSDDCSSTDDSCDK